MPVQSVNAERAIDVVELVQLLWQRKLTILAAVIVATAGGVAVAFLAPPVYRAEVLLAPTDLDQEASLPAGIGGLANLAGISLGGSSNSAERVAVLRSNAFAEDFILERELLPILFADRWDSVKSQWRDADPTEWPDIREGVEYFVDEVRSVEEDSNSGLIRFAIEWSDPEIAAEWAEDLVRRVNERIRARDLQRSEQKLRYLNAELENAGLVELRVAIARLVENEIQTITLARAVQDYAFRVIDPARAPREPSSPKKLLIIAVAVLAGLIVGVALALIAYAVGRRHSIEGTLGNA